MRTKPDAESRAVLVAAYERASARFVALWQADATRHRLNGPGDARLAFELITNGHCRAPEVLSAAWALQLATDRVQSLRRHERGSWGSQRWNRPHKRRGTA